MYVFSFQNIIGEVGEGRGKEDSSFGVPISDDGPAAYQLLACVLASANAQAHGACRFLFCCGFFFTGSFILLVPTSRVFFCAPWLLLPTRISKRTMLSSVEGKGEGRGGGRKPPQPGVFLLLPLLAMAFTEGVEGRREKGGGSKSQERSRTQVCLPPPPQLASLHRFCSVDGFFWVWFFWSFFFISVEEWRDESGMTSLRRREEGGGGAGEGEGR